MLTAVALPCTRWFDPLTVPLQMPPKPKPVWRMELAYEAIKEGYLSQARALIRLTYTELLLKDEEDEHP